MIGTRWFGATIGIALLAILIFLEILQAGGPPPPGSIPEGPPPPHAVFGAKFAALPAWVNIWMHFQDIIIGALLFFVLWKKEAQWYAFAVVANHVFLFAAMPFVPIEKLDLGLAALSHYIWIIPLFFMIRAWPSLDKSTSYGLWVTVAIAQITFSLCFDLPQGAMFVASLLS